MQPVAKYSERRFDGRRTFELYPDAVLVKGSSTFASDFEARVPLASLDANYARLRVRHPACLVGAGGAIFACVVRELLVGPLQLPWFDERSGFATALVVSGLVLCLATIRKVEFVRFTTQSGVVALDVARAGPDRAHFDEFVGAVVRQIRARSPEA